MLVAPVTPNHVIPFWLEIDFRKLSWTCSSRLSRKRMKWPTSVTAGFSDFSAQFTTNFVTAQALGWKKTSTSLSQEAFFKALRWRPFPLNIWQALATHQRDGSKYSKYKSVYYHLVLVALHTLSDSDFPFFNLFICCTCIPCKWEWWLIHAEPLNR